jgi:hypothetical protein
VQARSGRMKSAFMHDGPGTLEKKMQGSPWTLPRSTLRVSLVCSFTHAYQVAILRAH